MKVGLPRRPSHGAFEGRGGSPATTMSSGVSSGRDIAGELERAILERQLIVDALLHATY